MATANRSESPQRWAIVGGGMLGMTLAHRLAQAGREVTLFEAAPHLGGLASAWSLGEVTWDRHYHVILNSDTLLRALLNEIGLEREIQWVQTRTGFYVDGKLYSMSSAFEYLRFPPIGLLDKVRLAATILYASRVKDWKPLEAILVEDWLRRWSGARLAEKIWVPLLRAKLGESYRKTSAAFIWATINRMYAARRTGMRREMFGYVPGGYARILERFRQQLEAEGVRIRVSHPAQRVEPHAGGVALQFEGGHREGFDQAVLTVAAPVAARLCPALSAEEKTRLMGVEYLGIVCASLLLKRPLGRYYITNITDAWVPFTAVIEMSALVKPSEFGGKTLVYLPKYVAAGDTATFAKSDAELQEEFMAALLRMYPWITREDVLAVRISREKYVMPIPTLRYSERVPTMATSLPGIHVVNSSQIVNGTLNVNETLKLAEPAAARLIAIPRRDAAIAVEQRT